MKSGNTFAAQPSDVLRGTGCFQPCPPQCFLINRFNNFSARLNDINATFLQRNFRLVAFGDASVYQLSVQDVDSPRFARRQARYMQHTIMRPRP